MGGNSKRVELPLLAAFIFLSLATAALLIFSLRFFAVTPVGMRLGTWFGQISSSALVQEVVREARLKMPPLPKSPVIPTQSPLIPVTAGEPARAALANPVPVMDQPVTGQPELPLPAAEHAPTPTPVPVYQVVEKQPPEGSLVIPALGIDQPLTPVPVRGQEWDLSALGPQVGWLETTGAHPDDEQAMVLIGHVTLPPPGGPGPFLNLGDLQAGDMVEYRDGPFTYTYQVTSKEAVEPDRVERLYRSDGSRLLLVTCTSYNALERKYDLRLLVEARLVQVIHAAEGAVQRN